MLRAMCWIWMAAFCVAASIAQTAAPPQTIFEFHSGFWLNLHQFLCQQASAKDAARSDSPEWQAAVDYYRREIIPLGELGDEPAAINNRMSAAASATDLPAAGVDPKLVETLTKAAPIYRRVWWPGHNRTNLAWIEAVTPLLAKYGAPMTKDIARVYRVEWPSSPIRTDVAVYAGTHGAYTTTDPAHVTISSVDPSYRGMASLEMLFHETSHMLNQGFEAALNDEIRARNLLFRRRGFGHAILFYTAGEIARRYLGNYEPYGIKNGMYESGWPDSLPVLEKDWKPYLEGKTDFASAVHALATDYGVPKGHVAQALLPAASRLISTRFGSAPNPSVQRVFSRLQRPDSPGRFSDRFQHSQQQDNTSLPGEIRTAAKSVEMSLDAAGRSACATSLAHAFSLTSGSQRLVSMRFRLARRPTVMLRAMCWIWMAALCVAASIAQTADPRQTIFEFHSGF